MSNLKQNEDRAIKEELEAFSQLSLENQQLVIWYLQGLVSAQECTPADSDRAC